MKKVHFIEKKQQAHAAHNRKLKEQQEFLEKKRKGARKMHIIKESLIKKAKAGGFVMKKQKVVHQH